MMYLYHFGRHVVGRAAETVRRPVQIDLQLAHAKVGDANVAIEVEQNVVQLEITGALVGVR